MDSFDQLGLLAEISATLLGFVAVFIVLSRGDGRFAESDRHFIQALVQSSVFAVLLALIPRALSLYGFDVSVWKIATIVAIIVGSGIMVLMARAQMSMSREEASKIHWGWHVSSWGMGFAAAGLLFLGLVQSAYAAAFYVSAASIMVVLALWSFVAVVFRRFF